MENRAYKKPQHAVNGVNPKLLGKRLFSFSIPKPQGNIDGAKENCTERRCTF